MPEICPVDGCGSTHDTYTAVAMHMCKKADDGHPWETQNAALEHLADEGLIGVGTGGDGVVVDTSSDTSEPDEPDTSADTSEPTDGSASNPLIGDGDPATLDTSSSDTSADTSDDGGPCCADPNLKGEPGDAVFGPRYAPAAVAKIAPDGATLWQNESKTDPVKLDTGERICVNCEAIVEADGGIKR